MGSTEVLRRRIREELPAAVFKPVPRRLIYFGLNFGLLLAAWIVLPHTSGIAAKLALGVVAGHSIACVGFFAHELTHGAVLRAGFLRRALETLCWGVNVISPAMWRHLHNRTHHATAGTYDDPDRRFDRRQASFATRVYSDLFYPSRDLFRWNPVVFVHFIVYVVKHTANALGAPSSLLPVRVDFAARDRRRVAREVALIVVAHVLLWRWLGTLENVLLGSVLPLVVASTLIMSYVFTNHFPAPLREEPDVLACTLSVRVPRLLDVLHGNFSYHVEHHLLPGVSSVHYPLISSWLAENCGEDYRRVGFGEGWKLVMESPRWAREAVR